jgi:hypothetical protein
MPVDAREEAPDLVRITLRGRMAPADQAALLYFVTKAIERAGRIRLLIVLDGFEGWTTGEEWGDDALRLASDTPIVKAAFVGEDRWKEEVFAFVARPFRKAPIEYFEDEAAARSWLSV